MPKTLLTLTSQEVAKLLKVSVRRAEQMAEQGKISAVKLGQRWYFVKSDLETKYLQLSIFPKSPKHKHSA